MLTNMVTQMNWTNSLKGKVYQNSHNSVLRLVGEAEKRAPDLCWQRDLGDNKAGYQPNQANLSKHLRGGGLEEERGSEPRRARRVPLQGWE